MYKGRVSSCGQVIVYSVFVPFLFEYVWKRLPGGTENQAVFLIHVVGVHFYFNSLPDEAIRVTCFCGE